MLILTINFVLIRVQNINAETKTEDDTDIVAFSREELALLDEYFKVQTRSVFTR